MTFLHQFSVLAASRNEGLHPKLRALLDRAAASPFSEVSMRHDGLIQAGPSPDSEAVLSGVNVTLFSRELPRAAVAGSRPEMHKLSTASSYVSLAIGWNRVFRGPDEHSAGVDQPERPG